MSPRSTPSPEFRRALQLVEDIWDSIVEEARAAPGALPLSEAQLTELRRGREEHRRDSDSAIPWEQARAELFGHGDGK